MVSTMEAVAIVRCVACRGHKCVTRHCVCTKNGLACGVDCGCVDCGNPNGKTDRVSDPLAGVRATRSQAAKELPLLLRQPCGSPATAAYCSLKDDDLVQNVVGSAADVPFGAIASWQVWWEQATRQSFTVCAATRCRRKATCGAHVSIRGRPGIFILPHCQQCNHPSVVSWTNTIPGSLAVQRA